MILSASMWSGGGWWWVFGLTLGIYMFPCIDLQWLLGVPQEGWTACDPIRMSTVPLIWGTTAGESHLPHSMALRSNAFRELIVVIEIFEEYRMTPGLPCDKWPLQGLSTLSGTTRGLTLAVLPCLAFPVSVGVLDAVDSAPKPGKVELHRNDGSCPVWIRENEQTEALSHRDQRSSYEEQKYSGYLGTEKINAE